MPGLLVRGGVVTGSAAVEVGTESEGMVLGDTVNTASRLQSLAAPGDVLVDDVTRRASEAAIAYEDTGEQPVRGRERPIRAWRALRVVAERRGAGRLVGLEAPFTGRERQLEQIISAWEATAAEGRARAGLGGRRGRDGQVAPSVGVLEVHGRARASGALAPGALSLLRRGGGLLGACGDDPSADRDRGGGGSRPGPGEAPRRGPRARARRARAPAGRAPPGAPAGARGQGGARPRRPVLRLEAVPRAPRRRSDPVVLVFEDLQWADSGLLDFIDYLLEWSSDFPIFILTLGRPEPAAARPDWPLAGRSSRCRATRCASSWPASCPGSRDDLAGRIVERAEGVPLYAVETVRMLLDRGLLAQDGARYVVTGEVEELAVPETLQALLAAQARRPRAGRAGADPGRRGARAVVHRRRARRPRRALDRRGRAVARAAGRQAGRRLQRQRAVGRARAVLVPAGAAADDRVRHPVAPRSQGPPPGSRPPPASRPGGARQARSPRCSPPTIWMPPRAEPDATDAPTIRESALKTLAEAGRRAASLALGEEAQRIFDRATELAEDDATRADLLEQSGKAAWLAGDADAARERLGGRDRAVRRRRAHRRGGAGDGGRRRHAGDDGSTRRGAAAGRACVRGPRLRGPSVPPSPPSSRSSTCSGPISSGRSRRPTRRWRWPSRLGPGRRSPTR